MKRLAGDAPLTRHSSEPAFGSSRMIVVLLDPVDEDRPVEVATRREGGFEVTTVLRARVGAGRRPAALTGDQLPPMRLRTFHSHRMADRSGRCVITASDRLEEP